MGEDSSDTHSELQGRARRHRTHAPIDSSGQARAGIQAPSLHGMARRRKVCCRREQSRMLSGRERCMEVTCQPLRPTWHRQTSSGRIVGGSVVLLTMLQEHHAGRADVRCAETHPKKSTTPAYYVPTEGIEELPADGVVGAAVRRLGDGGDTFLLGASGGDNVQFPRDPADASRRPIDLLYTPSKTG